jgi:transcriptional regulator GlxA family with amidase domain
MIPGEPSGQVPVAFLIDDGATVIDFCGPWEVFQNAAITGVPGFRLYTVAPTRETIETAGNVVYGRSSGLKIVPDHTLASAPQPGVIVIGAQSRSDMAAKINWIREASASADIVMSVCTGAFLLGNSGLIDGLTATTHHRFYEAFQDRFPSVKLIRDRRFVDNGKFLSAGGLTSGIDAALHVVARYYGIHTAQQVSDYMEHWSKHGWLTGESANLPATRLSAADQAPLS